MLLTRKNIYGEEHLLDCSGSLSKVKVIAVSISVARSLCVMKTNVYKTDTNSVSYPVPMKKFAWLFDLVFSQKHTIVLCCGAF